MEAVVDRETLISYMNENTRVKKVKFYIANQCAPVIEYLKPANLLMMEEKDQKEYACCLGEWKLDHYALYQEKTMISMLIYRRNLLERVIDQPENKEYLYQCGYENQCMDQKLSFLGERIRKYYTDHRTYPHELGIFLGYPLHDVIGFIQNQGSRSLLSGYWKVYAQAEQAKRIFHEYDESRRRLLSKLVVADRH